MPGIGPNELTRGGVAQSDGATLELPESTRCAVGRELTDRGHRDKAHLSRLAQRLQLLPHPITKECRRYCRKAQECHRAKKETSRIAGAGTSPERKVRIASRVAAFQSFAVVSKPAETRRVPSGENATVVPRPCPGIVASSWPVRVSHNLIVLSALPESSRAPSGENATELTRSSCPPIVRISWPLASHSLSTLSPPPETKSSPSGETAIDWTPAAIPLEGSDRLARGCVPHLHRIEAGREQARAVGRERCRSDLIPMSVERPD